MTAAHYVIISAETLKSVFKEDRWFVRLFYLLSPRDRQAKYI